MTDKYTELYKQFPNLSELSIGVDSQVVYRVGETGKLTPFIIELGKLAISDTGITVIREGKQVIKPLCGIDFGIDENKVQLILTHEVFPVDVDSITLSGDIMIIIETPNDGSSNSRIILMNESNGVVFQGDTFSSLELLERIDI